MQEVARPALRGFAKVAMIPDHFVEHTSQNDMYADAGLDRASIVATALTTLGYDEAAMAAALAQIS